MWPASALLTGNGVAFVLRVPGTVHGDWWSCPWLVDLRCRPGGRASLEVRDRLGRRARLQPVEHRTGRRPSSCSAVDASSRSTSGGGRCPGGWGSRFSSSSPSGFTDALSRWDCCAIALVFWATFALGIAGLALAGHAMTARWHLGPISGFHFWWVLVTSPEVLVFLFFMITDPRTAPRGSRARLALRDRARRRCVDPDRAHAHRVRGEGGAALDARDRLRRQVRARAHARSSRAAARARDRRRAGSRPGRPCSPSGTSPRRPMQRRRSRRGSCRRSRSFPHPACRRSSTGRPPR